MPIDKLSDQVRLPRLGKIHLGIRETLIKDGKPVIRNGKPVEYPKATPYFVLPKDHPDYDALVKLFGEQPNKLEPIVIPNDDEEIWASQYYRCYSGGRALLCAGDGIMADRWVDEVTRELPTQETKTVTRIQLPCLGRDCPIYVKGDCHERMNIRFALPDVPGLGIWQVDTGSINNILNINSEARLIKNYFGRITGVPLTLSLEPETVNQPKTRKKINVFLLHLRTKATISQLAEHARSIHEQLQLRYRPEALQIEYDKETERMTQAIYGPKTAKPPDIADLVPAPEDAPPTEDEPTDDFDRTFPIAANSPPVTPEPAVDSKWLLSWLKEALKIVNWKPVDVAVWVNAKYGIEYKGRNLTNVLGDMNAEQLRSLKSGIEALADAADGRTG